MLYAMFSPVSTRPGTLQASLTSLAFPSNSTDHSCNSAVDQEIVDIVKTVTSGFAALVRSQPIDHYYNLSTNRRHHIHTTQYSHRSGAVK